MANELRIRQLSIGGLVEDNPLTSGATTLTSAALAAVSGGVASTQYMPIVLDPDGVDGAPEIIYVTALTAGAGSATIVRAQEGTTARAHVANTPWVHGALMTDLPTCTTAIGTGGGDYSTSSSTFADIGTNDLLVTVAANVGDLLICTLGCQWYVSSSTPQLRIKFTFAGTADSALPTNGLFDGAHDLNSNFTDFTWRHQVASGDLSSGTVAVKPQFACSANTVSIRNDGTNGKPLMMVQNWRSFT